MAKYEVTIRVSGQATFTVESDTEAGAVEIASEKYEDKYHAPEFRIGDGFDVGKLDCRKLPEPADSVSVVDFISSVIAAQNMFAENDYEVSDELRDWCESARVKYSISSKKLLDMAISTVPLAEICRIFHDRANS